MKPTFVLITTSIALVGAYYVYDQPAAINKMLYEYLQPSITDHDYQYALNLMCKLKFIIRSTHWISLKRPYSLKLWVDSQHYQNL